MKYRQQVDEERMYTVDCEVEADSPEEAKQKILAGEYHELDEQYHGTEGRELSGEMTVVDDSDEALPYTDDEFKEFVGILDGITLTRLGMRRAFATITALKKKFSDAQCMGAELIAEGSAEWEERANNAERDLKDLRARLKDAVDKLNHKQAVVTAAHVHPCPCIHMPFDGECSCGMVEVHTIAQAAMRVLTKEFDQEEAG